MSREKPVRALNAEVARKIAAGEVIDRPNAIIRELMDNAIDSGADEIIVEICGGGIDKIRVVDNGSGMTKEDLQNCARPHATSKISSEEDLLKLSTLGFRGEALASIAAVSRLTILSGSYQMKASITEDHIITLVAERKGTVVQAEGVFENFPARRQFLKRPATEALMCKNIFIEKALANPSVACKFIQDGETKLNLPKNQNQKERYISATSLESQKDLFFTVFRSQRDENPEWKITIIIGEMAIARNNKKDIQIFVNKRRIQEYSLVQAVEYGAQGFFPNGTYPVCTVFAEVRPDLVDFNIHPAKKEARFSDIASIHHAISSSLKDFFLSYTRQNFKEDRATDEIIKDFSRENNIRQEGFQDDFQDCFQDDSQKKNTFSPNSLENGNAEEKNIAEYNNPYKKHISYTTQYSRTLNVGDFRAKYFSSKNDSSSHLAKYAFEGQNNNLDFEESQTPSNLKSLNSNGFDLIKGEDDIFQKKDCKVFSAKQIQKHSSPKSIRFIGFCLGTFLLAEKNKCLYVIDQHAVHERIIFDKLMNSQENAKCQKLLIPYKIETESKAQDKQMEEIKDSLNKIGFSTKFIQEGLWEISSVPERWRGSAFELKSLILEKHLEAEEIIRSILAMSACKAAIKDGYIIDEASATELVKAAFELEDPHCPHGRPVYTVFSREKLFELVKRT